MPVISGPSSEVGLVGMNILRHGVWCGVVCGSPVLEGGAVWLFWQVLDL